MSKKVSGNIHCTFCNGTGRRKLSPKLQETADIFNGNPKTCKEAYDALSASGDLSRNRDVTVVHARVKRLHAAGALRKVKKTDEGWTFVKV